MIIDELILHDFGVYSGQQIIALTPPSQSKPVTLFYGLNGHGKTTILEALQTALFGQNAPFLNGQNYNKYIAERINRKSRHGQASLRLDFHRSENGQTVKYRIYRIWKQGLQGPRETLEVIKDGHKSDLLSKNWSQYVEEIMPSRLAHFFFFDGEKIEEYASEDGARQLIETGLYNLLGLNLINRSLQDLTVLRRRKLDSSLESNADTDSKNEIRAKEENLSKLSERREKLLIGKAELQTHKIDACQRSLDSFDKQYKESGGSTWERRDKISETLTMLKEEKVQNTALVKEAVSGLLPISLLRDHFFEIDRLKNEINDISQAASRYEITEYRDKEILDQIKKAGAGADIICSVKEFMDASLNSLKFNSETTLPFKDIRELDGFEVDVLSEELVATQAALRQHLDARQDIDHKIAELMIEIETIPDTQDIKKLTEQRAEVEKEMARFVGKMENLEEELRKLNHEIQKAEDNIEAIQLNLLNMDIENKLSQQYVERIDKANKTLQDFSKKVIHGKINDIEQYVLESYLSLLRKENLVHSIQINPETFDISLQRDDGDIVSSSQLSAGERQLLVISILWGVSKASAKPFPVAVDTPFGRLDSSHRKNMVSNYFTCASHQIMIFSTDEEIVGDYFDVIKPSTGLVYKLEHDNKLGTTKIETDHAIS